MSSRITTSASAPRAAARTAQPKKPAAETPAARPPVFPSLAEIFDLRGPFLIPIGILIVTRVVFWNIMPLANEDAYITFRYARNLASGHGLVYNPGEHVMGFSSPLWAVWNALGYLLTKNPLLWSRLSSMIADIVTALALGGLLKRGYSPAAAWCFNFFFAGWPFFAAVSGSGMEMNAFFALISLAAALVAAGHPASGPALAAVVLTRPEGVVAAFIIGLGASWRDRAIAAGLVAAGLIGLWAYYGTILPQSVIAKSRLYGTPGPWAGRHWWEWLSPFPFGRWPRQGETTHLLVMTVLTAPGFIMGAVELVRRRAWGLARAIGAPVAIWLGYASLGVAYFWWYMLVPLAGIAALASVGFPAMTRGRAVAISLVLFVSGMWTIAPDLYIARASEETLSFARAADILVREGKEGQKVMLEPIGIVGYRAPMVVLDEVGLVTPAIAKRRVDGGAGWYTDVVREQKPDWLVVRAGVLRTGEAFAGAGSPFRSGEERDTLLAGYDMIDQGRPDNFKDASLNIMRRKP